LYRWIVRWMGECKLARFQANKMRMQRLAFYSREVLHMLRSNLELEYEQTQGYLQLFRTAKDLALAGPARDLLAASGVSHEWLSAEAARTVEPGLCETTPLAGAMYLPDDEAGNCALFAQGLRRHAQAQGVRFEFGRGVQAIEQAAGGRLSVVTSEGQQSVNAVVLAAGVASAAMLGKLGIHIPLYPVKGYSATAPLSPAAFGPKAALMDETYKVAITRLGKRIRIAGTAELGGRDMAIRQRSVATLLKVARDWFPGAALLGQATYWCGARPMLPEGAPLLGPTPVKGLFVNVGHGSSGWAMACGSGAVLADCVTGRAPAIDLDGLTLARYETGARR
jgi:D-amino-acid dehydrogenase